MQTTTLYDQDFHAWAQRQVELLRSGQLAELDIENLVEEIESTEKHPSIQTSCHKFAPLLKQISSNNP